MKKVINIKPLKEIQHWIDIMIGIILVLIGALIALEPSDLISKSVFYIILVLFNIKCILSIISLVNAVRNNIKRNKIESNKVEGNKSPIISTIFSTIFAIVGTSMVFSILSTPFSSLHSLSAVLAFWALFAGIYKCALAISMRKTRKKLWIVLLMLSIVVILIGVSLFNNVFFALPLFNSQFGCYLALYGFSSLLEELGKK